MSDYGDDYMQMKFCMLTARRENDIVSRTKISDSEYIFECNDGDKYLFDIVGDVVKRIGYPGLDHITDELWKKEFARRLKKMAIRKGYYMKDVAEKLGVSENTISRYMTGKRIPDAYTVKRLSEILDCSVEYLTNFDYLL